MRWVLFRVLTDNQGMDGRVRLRRNLPILPALGDFVMVTVIFFMICCRTHLFDSNMSIRPSVLLRGIFQEVIPFSVVHNLSWKTLRAIVPLNNSRFGSEKNRLFYQKTALLIMYQSAKFAVPESNIIFLSSTLIA